MDYIMEICFSESMLLFTEKVGQRQGPSQELVYGKEYYHNEARSQARKSLHKCPEVTGANIISFPEFKKT